MTYVLNPFTSILLGLLGIGPFWTLELAELLIVVGLVFALTDKASTISLITAITRTFTGNNKNFSVEVTPGFAKRTGIALILAGLVLSAAAIDGIASTPSIANYFSTGGPAFTPCPVPFDNLPCYHPGGAGISCSSTVTSPCWTKVQTGVASCTINANSVNCLSAPQTFSTPYLVKPSLKSLVLNSTCGANCQLSASYTLGGTNLAFPVSPFSFQATNGTGWNMNSGNTLLNGNNTQQYVIWGLPVGWTAVVANVQLCVDVVTVPGVPSLWIQYSPDLVSWNNLGSDGSQVNPSTPGFQCGPIEAIAGQLIVGTYYFRVVGNDIAGPIVDVFGNVEMLITGGQVSLPTVSASVACNPAISTLSTTSIRVLANCGANGISSSKTFTIDWAVGIPG